MTRFFEQPIPLKLRPLEADGVIVPANIVNLSSDESVKLMTTKKGDMQPFDQADVPTARVGRIQSRDSLNGSDVVGVITFANLSPIGNPEAQTDGVWEVRVGLFSSLGEDFAK